MKRTVLSAFFGITLMSSCCFSQENHPMHYQQTYDKAQTKLITPTTSPSVDRGVDVFISGSVIYWNSRLGDFNVVQSGHSIRDSESNFSNLIETDVRTSVGDNGSHSSSNDLGFKAKVGIALEHDGWDSFIEYTWLRPKTTDHFKDDTFTSTMDHFRGIPFDHNVADFSSGTSEWKLHFNSALWELGRSFFISPKLILRPHFGLKGVWTTQRFELQENDLQVRSELLGAIITGSYLVKQRQTYWGVGPRAGFNTSWQLSKNFSIVSIWGITPLWGNFEAKRNDFLTSVDQELDIFNIRLDTLNNEVVKMSFKNHNVNMAYDYQIGFRGDAWFDDDNYRIRIQITWEQQLLSNFNQFIYIEKTKPTDDLAFQGVTAELRFDF
ncbi:hypothetical protein COB11_02920 [Candidatus Aerophobetes bacterium]|uniref:Uncharacterized protein n=1 Tax=Aerophobetes bacterium TaxID=2030807 RepID=A0A2A4YKY4_UNCAE|nr:MAG: hypothetical protein COB11_02920 [Candidatus Aerophobetes bacterium]